MLALLAKLQGKKTYVVAALTVLFAVLGFLLGLLSPEEAGSVLLQGLGLAGLRAGIAKK